MPNIVVKTNDDKRYEVDVEIIKLCPTIDDLLRTDGMGVNGDSREITLEGIDGSPLELVLKWCERHKEDQFNEDMAQQISETDYPLFDFWDQMFIEKVVFFVLRSFQIKQNILISN
jgi:hypothetical protein